MIDSQASDDSQDLDPAVVVEVAERWLWVRRVARKKPAELAPVLEIEEAPPPLGLRPDSENAERLLGLNGRHLYFYLHRTGEAFGYLAYVLEIEHEQLNAAGTVSPFDSGGLIKHIKPVCDVPVQQKAFLHSWSWPARETPSLIEVYPGAGRAAAAQYRKDYGAPMGLEGPHSVWPNHGGVAERIWNSNNDWQAWTYELRIPTAVPTGTKVVAWACNPPYEKSIRKRWRQAGDPKVVSHLQDVYVPGGVPELVLRLKRGTL